MNDELKRLRDRVAQLEAVEHEYLSLKQLIDHVANNGNLAEYGGNALLYVDQTTRQVMSASPRALAILGCTHDQIRQHTIDELETAADELPQNRITYVQNANEETIYTTAYRHHDGHRLPIRVYRRTIKPDSQNTILQYRLEDLSLRQKLWHELRRREDTGFQFREKLKQLNEINLQLAEAKSLHDLCKIGIELGMEKLGFDRMSIWLHDAEAQRMVGTYGVDETGAIRDERSSSWSYADTYVVDFIEGKNTHFVIEDNAPIYNHTSQIIGYGWHIAVPLLYRGQFMGFMAADNFLNRLELKDFQPELLRLYGLTVGHLAAHQRELDTVRKLSDAIQHSNSMIGILNDEAVIEFVNTAFLYISGYKAEDVIGKPLGLFLPEAEYQPIWNAISNHTAWQGELTQHKHSGEVYETIVLLSPIKTGDDVHNFVLVQEDITGLKRARKYEFDLRLEQARARMVETFVRDLRHEFRTALSIIKVKGYLIQKITDEAKREKFLQQIQQQVDGLSTMVDDLIYIVQLESETDLNLESVNLKLLVETVLKEFAAEAKPIQWQLHLPAIPNITGDSQKLMRAIRELVKNAVQYTPLNGTITVTLDCVSNQVSLKVQDTGIGIPQDEIDKIFIPLYRVDQSRTEPGAGLGLSIAKLIVEVHHGAVLVNSTPAGGSIFEIRLPLFG